jgi:hypothetical protein
MSLQLAQIQKIKSHFVRPPANDFLKVRSLFTSFKKLNGRKKKNPELLSFASDLFFVALARTVILSEAACPTFSGKNLSFFRLYFKLKIKGVIYLQSTLKTGTIIAGI